MIELGLLILVSAALALVSAEGVRLLLGAALQAHRRHLLRRAARDFRRYGGRRYE